MNRKELSLSDRFDYDWMTDMYELQYEMMTSETPNALNEHTVLYGDGRSKIISHNVWMAFQAFKKRIHS